MPPKGRTPKNTNTPTRESTNNNKKRTDCKSPPHDNSIDVGVSNPPGEAAPGDNKAAINKNNNKDTGRGHAAKSTPRDSLISIDVILPLGGTAQTGDNKANNNKSAVEPHTDNSPGANVGVLSGETALTDDNNAPTVPTTETDNTPATTNNTVDNEPAEIQNKIQDNNKITSKMTPTDHINSATALRSADHGGQDDSILSAKLSWNCARNLIFLAIVVMARIRIFCEIVRNLNFLRLS
jgi:hypothetical protein